MSVLEISLCLCVVCVCVCDVSGDSGVCAEVIEVCELRLKGASILSWGSSP